MSTSNTIGDEVPQESKPGRNVLVSVYNKTNLHILARLAAPGIRGGPWNFISTGGTAKALRELGLTVTDISDFTGFPEMFGGRLKTLHPKVHGGILFRRKDMSDVHDAHEHGIIPIDMVVVNLYPFEETVAKPGCTRDQAVEQIDIGGPTMLRSAAKNFKAVTVIVDPNDYEAVVCECEQFGGTTLGKRKGLAVKVFRRTAAYDNAIATSLADFFESDRATDWNDIGMG